MWISKGSYAGATQRHINIGSISSMRDRKKTSPAPFTYTLSDDASFMGSPLKQIELRLETQFDPARRDIRGLDILERNSPRK